jgi:hypothetical protein
MKSIKVASIAWAVIYFVVGAVKSFTLNSNDTWASLVLLFGLFLLPLPITLLAVWFPKFGGVALLGCVALNAIAVADVIVARHSYPVSEIGHFILFTVLYNIPHLFFGWDTFAPATRQARLASL